MADLLERIAAEERHRQSLEEKHQHARQALEHFRQSSKEQRDQEQRKHEQQVQYLQSELRTLNETLTTKQHEVVQAHQEGVRLLGDLSRAQSDLYQSQEEVRNLRPLKDSLAFAQRRTEELGQKLVEQEAATRQLDASSGKLTVKVNDLLERNQQLELELVAAKASVAAQEQIVGNMLQRLSGTLPEPNLAETKQVEAIVQRVKKVPKKPIETGT